MSIRSRYTSPLHAGTRFVAQRGLLKPLVWRLTTVTVLGGRAERATVRGGVAPVAVGELTRP